MTSSVRAFSVARWRAVGAGLHIVFTMVGSPSVEKTRGFFLWEAMLASRMTAVFWGPLGVPLRLRLPQGFR